MPYTIAVINQKGGVGKSTTALTLATIFASRGKRVLLLDMDAQGNLSFTLGASRTGPSVFHVLTQEAGLKDAIQRIREMDFVPASRSLAKTDVILATETGKEYRLREAIDTVSADYDYIIIDTPPALGTLSVNALAACDWAIIPAQADIYSLQGIDQLTDSLEAVRKYCNPKLRVVGILLTRFDGRTILSRQIVDMADKFAQRLQTKVLKTRIRETVTVKESQLAQKTLLEYAPNSQVTADYEALADELLADLEGERD